MRAGKVYLSLWERQLLCSVLRGALRGPEGRDRLMSDAYRALLVKLRGIGGGK